MKRWIAFIICLCMTVSGCSRHPASEPSLPSPADEVTHTPTEAPAIPPIAYEKPLTAAALIPYSEIVQGASGSTRYSYSSENLSLVINEQDVAQGVVLDFTNRNDQLLYAAVNDLDTAQEYAEEPLFCDIRYDVSRLDHAVLSLAGNEQYFDGTQRSGETTFSFTYDMRAGNYMTLQDILDPGYSADTLAAYMIEALADKADCLFEDYADSINALFSSNAPVENWYFTEKGLCFYFNPYEIAPQSQGILSAEIPYEKLTGILKDIYFPGESVTFMGKLIMSDFEDAPVDSISRIAEVKLDSSGSMYMIHTQGTVCNVRVETGSWTSQGAFQAENTVLYAQALTEDYALMLQLKPEDLGRLCITYQSGDGIIRTPWQANS